MSSVNTSQISTPARGTSRRWRDVALLGGLFALMLVGLAGLAAVTGWEETKAQLARLSLVEVTVLLTLSLVNYFFRAIRWHIFARCLGLRTTLAQNTRHYLGGFAMTATPGRVGELIRMRWLRRETGWAFERTAPLVLIDRASDLAAIALLLAGALSFAATGVTGAVPVAILALMAAYVATRPGLLASIATYSYRATGILPRIFVRLRRAALSLKAFSSPQIVASALALGTIGWAAEGYAFHLLLVWMGADIGLASAILIFTFATIAGGLTGAPGGIGGAEAAMVALLSLQGVPLEISLPATAVIRITTLWFAIGIGLLVFPVAERLSRNAEHDLENN